MKKLLTLTISILSFGTNSSAQSWTTHSVGSTAEVYYMSFPTNDTGYVSLLNGTMRKTMNGALNWTAVTAPSSFTTPVDFVNGQKGFCFSSNGVAMTINGAQTWNDVLTDPVNFGNDLCVVNSSVIYAAFANASTDSLYLYQSLNGGTTWTLKPVVQMLMMYNDLFFVNPDTGFISAGPWIMKTTDGGQTWNNVYTDATSDFVTHLHTQDGVHYYAVTQQLQFIVSNDGGNNWAPFGPGNANPGYGVSFLGATNGFVCGGDGISSGYIEYTSNGGQTWVNVYTGNSLSCMDFPSLGTGYAAGKNGVIVKYDGVTGVAEETHPTIKLFPNPATDFLNIENLTPGDIITVQSMNGEIVLSQTASDDRMRLDLASLAEGMYIVEVRGEKFRSEEKVMVR